MENERFHELAEVLRSFGDLDMLATEVELFDGVEDVVQPNTIEELTEALEAERSMLTSW